MHIKAPYSITDCRRFFAQPATARQRQYEALRAFFVEGLSGDAARRFGYSPGAFRVLCHAFRRGQLPDFFATARTGPREQPKKSRAQEQIVALRKRNYSVYEISQALAQQGTPLSATAVREVLAQEGFAPLPRRRDDERPIRVGPHPEPVANVHDFILAPREFTRLAKSSATSSICRPTSPSRNGKSPCASTGAHTCLSSLPPASSINPSPSRGGKGVPSAWSNSARIDRPVRAISSRGNPG